MVLLDEDKEYLEAKGFHYELVDQNDGNTYLVIKEYRLPSGYTINMVDLMIIIPPMYPAVGLDMFWVSPDIMLANGDSYPPAADVHTQYLGIEWQRFSRHYPWRSGVDSLATHLIAAQKSLMI